MATAVYRVPTFFWGETTLSPKGLLPNVFGTLATSFDFGWFERMNDTFRTE